ncbi:MAG: hypothetical protein IKS08_01895 [Alphaproteobacteria bacterium]|nr:hypothetical protein [Alphaproteobacteria bacterium]
MYRFFAFFLALSMPVMAVADDAGDAALAELYETYETVRQFCDGISDRISSVSGVSKVNTAVTATGTVTAGGALVAGIMKSQTDKKIEELQKKICERGGCDPDKVAAMSDEEFLHSVAQPFIRQMELDRELQRLQAEKDAATAKSKKLGNWRTGLLVGTTATNVASAIIAGLNRNQSDLIQQITACNAAVDKLRVARTAAINSGVDPIENPMINEFNTTIESCGALNVADIDKIEKRMTVVMGTSIGGAVIGAVGAGTSIAANKDSVRNDDTDAGKQKEKNLNTAANVSAGLATATGAVGTGFNISLITLTKKILKSAEQCEATL